MATCASGESGRAGSSAPPACAAIEIISLRRTGQTMRVGGACALGDAEDLLGESLAEVSEVEPEAAGRGQRVPALGSVA